MKTLRLRGVILRLQEETLAATSSMDVPAALARIPSGVTGLDLILRGGFLQGGVVVIAGTPGTGKTILGNQICFNHVAAGGRAVYVTLLAESHSRMLAHLQSLEFFDPSVIGSALYYVSGYSTLEQEGTAGLLRLLRQVVRGQEATLLVIDGLVNATMFANSDLDVKEFIHALQVQMEAEGCTTILLGRGSTGNIEQPENTLVDGLLLLTDQLIDQRAVREIEVRKFRGSGHLRGRHIFAISNRGIEIYPRTEARYQVPQLPQGQNRVRHGFSIPHLDAMLHAGVLSASTTLLVGPAGSGKTLLGLHFLHAGAEVGENGLFFGFFEPISHLISKANQVGLDFQRNVERDLIEILWQSPLEGNMDLLASRLLDAVKRRGVRRVVIDSLAGLLMGAMHPARTELFLTALIQELRALGVTILYTVESATVFGSLVELPVTGATTNADNIVFMRYVELRSQLYRLISILKVRDSAYDRGIREFRITEDGIDVADTFATAEAILTGIARDVPPGPHLTGDSRAHTGSPDRQE
jgi:circadian clock protein KaiC